MDPVPPSPTARYLALFALFQSAVTAIIVYTAIRSDYLFVSLVCNTGLQFVLGLSAIMLGMGGRSSVGFIGGIVAMGVAVLSWISMLLAVLAFGAVVTAGAHVVKSIPMSGAH